MASEFPLLSAAAAVAIIAVFILMIYFFVVRRGGEDAMWRYPQANLGNPGQRIAGFEASFYPHFANARLNAAPAARGTIEVATEFGDRCQVPLAGPNGEPVIPTILETTEDPYGIAYSRVLENEGKKCAPSLQKCGHLPAA